MDPDQYRRVQEVFLAALDLPENERRGFLEKECGFDSAVLESVRAMLEEDSSNESLLDGDVAHVAANVLDPPAETMGPRQFGPYRIVRLLGEGGMGVVYLAERDDLGNQAAIKILRDAWLSPARRERFATEQRTLARLSHPSIARLYDADTLADGTPWFAMEYVDGIPITEYCRRHHLSVNQRLRVFRSVCDAVEYAHEHAVIHRDLKPSNILVGSSGGVRLLDFGIAKHLDVFDSPVDQTRTGLRLMTPAYAAPEQMRAEQVGVFTDVYALGVILYELLAGKTPYDIASATPGEAERAILEQDPQKPSLSLQRERPKAGWPDLDVLCLTAMHKEQQRRYRSVEALIRDIDHYLNGEPLEARPDSISYRLRKFISRNRKAVAVSALGLFAIIGLIAFFTVRLAVARNGAEATAARLQRVQQFMLNLFQGGDKAAGPAADLKVVSLVDRGVKEAQALQREPEVQAQMFVTLGGIYRKLGNLSEADRLMQAALDRRKALFGADHPQVAESTLELGLLRIDQARYDDAERLIRQALSEVERRRPQDAAATARATAALGKLIEARGSYDKAIPILEKAAQLQAAAAGESLDLAADWKELADAQFYAGRYDICQNLTERSLAIHKHLVGERHPLVADDLINLGAVQFERGRYPEAERFYRQALEINRSWYGSDNPETASTLSMLGRSLVMQQRYDEAVKVVEEALAIQEHVYGPMHPRVANVLNELGTVALQREKYQEAAARFQRMLEIYKTAYGTAHYQYGLAMANLASVYLAQGEFKRAEKMFNDVLQCYAKSLSPDHAFVGIAQIKLGRAIAGEKRFEDAEVHLLSGYNILRKQTSPQVSWLRSARKELATVYAALNEPDKAAQFRDVK